MSWRVEWLEEAAKDMRKLGKAEQKQVLKGIAKVSENPLPSSQGGYGKPLRNANRAHLAGLCKIKFRDLGIRVVYKPVLKEGTMVIIVVGVRTDEDDYRPLGSTRREPVPGPRKASPCHGGHGSPAGNGPSAIAPGRSRQRNMPRHA